MRVYHGAPAGASAADFGRKTITTYCAKRVRPDRVSGIPTCKDCAAIKRGARR